MLIPAEILSTVRDNPREGAIEVCEFVQSSMLEDASGWTPEEYAYLLEGYALISSLYEAGRIEFGTFDPAISRDVPDSCKNIFMFLKAVRAELVEQSNAHKLESLKAHFSNTIIHGFHYEFTDGDLKRVQQLLNELRDLIAANTEIEPDHKRRLLKRLEQMQSELHKEVSDLDRYYGLAVEAGVLMKKLGEGAKPIVDLIKEVTSISWVTQARAENLPSGSEPPLLGNESGAPKLD
ncbi:hypothetical protein [Pseudomonas putida]|jgi:hypothetical protein|uniref:hypothetical protein n=1 Tax=Pseudomonas putida TaxID=303 RepID=UPI002363FD40|nr:hypothetical protein [Pseudomonas putida]MDD2098836.1 hypothetical protein [Pseudomonas putida]